MIVDTSFILDAIDDVEATVQKEREPEAEGVPLVIPAMTLLELYIGVGKVVNSKQERQQVEAILNTDPLMEMTLIHRFWRTLKYSFPSTTVTKQSTKSTLHEQSRTSSN